MTLFIGAEWGTAAVVARLIDADGTLLDTMTEPVRLTDLSELQRIERLHRWRTTWPQAAGPILLAGMIGSATGIALVDHLPCPTGINSIARRTLAMKAGGVDIVLLPGLSSRSIMGDHDVLRGEEVAAAGLIARSNGARMRLVSVPGMHGKWITLGEGQVQRFHTAMTVELYRTLAERSILSPLMRDMGEDGPAFRAGVDRGVSGGALARLMFAVRAAVLAGEMKEADAASHLWGILIGADVRDAIAMEEAPITYHVAGDAQIARLFHAALAHLGVPAMLEDSARLAATGFAEIRKALTMAQVA